MSLLSLPEIIVNSSSVTRGNNCKLLNQAFTTTYGIYTEDTPPRLCGTRLASGARLLSVQVNQTPGLYAGPGVYPGPASNRSFTVYMK